MIENDESRKAMFAEINKKQSNSIRTESRKKGKERFEERDTRTSKAPTKNSLPISDAQIIPNSNFLLYAGKKAFPIFLSFSGLPTSGTIAKAIAPSIEDSLSFYYKSNKIDDALFIGLKSFVKNYAKNYSIDYLQQTMQNRTDDDVFTEILEGTKIISSIIIENM